MAYDEETTRARCSGRPPARDEALPVFLPRIVVVIPALDEALDSPGHETCAQEKRRASPRHRRGQRLYLTGPERSPGGPARCRRGGEERRGRQLFASPVSSPPRRPTCTAGSTAMPSTTRRDLSGISSRSCSSRARRTWSSVPHVILARPGSATRSRCSATAWPAFLYTPPVRVGPVTTGRSAIWRGGFVCVDAGDTRPRRVAEMTAKAIRRLRRYREVPASIAGGSAAPRRSAGTLRGSVMAGRYILSTGVQRPRRMPPGAPTTVRDGDEPVSDAPLHRRGQAPRAGFAKTRFGGPSATRPPSRSTGRFCEIWPRASRTRCSSALVRHAVRCLGRHLPVGRSGGSGREEA